ncbi:DNA polymerase III subunit gamma/tau [Patescibacteria group bacterium]|nr:MAG: DNA polymerase III subunit gamma/tau [Patescibacteria group bacterium]
MRGALYLRWRPRVFSELTGQDHIKKTLLNALKEGKVGHAYLFCGPRGTGKTTTARLLAKALNCESPKKGEPCNKCESCEEINEDKALDLIEIDAASNRGIDEIRDLREKVRVAPAKSKYKVFIIDEVHMLTKEAFNALLKTLEEPPKHVIFVLATTEVQKVPLTILSRCQRFDFHLIGQENLRDKLKKIIKKEKIDIDDKSLDLVVRKAKGSYRDAESLLDQLAAFSKQKIDFEMVKDILGLPDFVEIGKLAEALSERDNKKALKKLEELLDKGEDPEQLTISLIDFFRDGLLVKVGGEDLTGELGKDELKFLEKISKEITEKDFLKIINLLIQAQTQLKFTEVQRLPLELAFLDFCEGGGSMPAEDKKTVKESKKEIFVKKTREVPKKIKEIINKKEPEEKPSPKPTSPVRQGDQKITIEEIKEKWDQILEKIKEANHSVKAFLAAGNPTEVAEGNWLIVYYRYGFHKEKMDELRNRQVVEKAILEVTGCNLRLRGKIEEEEEKPKPIQRDRLNRKDNHNSTKEVFEVFGGGKIINND